jgi:hypothetical protein
MGYLNDPKENSEIYHRGLQIKRRRLRNKNAGGIRTGESTIQKNQPAINTYVQDG